MRTRLIVILTLFSFLFPVTPVSAAPGVESIQTRFIRQQRSTKVFAVIDGKRVVVPRKYVIQSGQSIKNVPVLPVQELKRIPETRFVKTEDDSKVYAVTAATKKPLTESQQEAATDVLTVPDEQLDAYRLAPAQTVVVQSSAESLQYKKGSIVRLPVTQNQLTSCGGGMSFNNRAHFVQCDTFWDGTNLIKFVLPENVAKKYRVVAVDINDNDQIVGNLQPLDSAGTAFGSPYARSGGFLWEKGVFTLLPQITAEYRVIGISNDGTIWSYHLGQMFKSPVGYDFKTDKGAGLYSLKNGLMKEHVRTRTKNGGIFAQVNDAGDALAEEGVYIDNIYYSRKLIWKSGTFSAFEPSSTGYLDFSDMNEVGQASGNSSEGAFVLDSGNKVLLPGEEGFTIDINNSGIVIGRARLADPKYDFKIDKAVIWKNNQLVQFDAIFPQFAQEAEECAQSLFAINDAGNILCGGNGSNSNVRNLFIATLPDNIPR